MDKAKELPKGWEEADTPRATSWSVALGSALLVAGFIHGAQLASEGYCMAMLQRQLKASLADESQATVVMLDTRFEQLLPPEEGRIKAARELITALSVDDIEKAARLLETSKNLPAIPAITKTRTHVVAATELMSRGTSLEDQLRAVEQKQQRSQQLKSLLAKDLSALLGVGPQAELPAGESMAFYESGILASLPVLDGIPDAIADNKVLAKYTSKQVAETLVTIGPKNLALSDRMKDLRARSLQLKAEETALLAQRKAAEAELDGHEARVEEAVAACREQLANIVLEIAVPKLDQQVIDAYGRVVDWGKLAGVELPQLSRV